MSAYQTEPGPTPPVPERFYVSAAIESSDGRMLWEARTEIKAEPWMTPQLIAEAIAMIARKTAAAIADRP